MRGFSSLGHVALKVKDVERTLAFYVGKLGCAEMMRLNKPDGSLWIVYLRVTDDQYIEIFPGAVGDRSPGWDAIGVNHFCLCVDDLDGVLAQMRKPGSRSLLARRWGSTTTIRPGSRIRTAIASSSCKSRQTRCSAKRSVDSAGKRAFRLDGRLARPPCIP